MIYCDYRRSVRYKYKNILGLASSITYHRYRFYSSENSNTMLSTTGFVNGKFEFTFILRSIDYHSQFIHLDIHQNIQISSPAHMSYIILIPDRRFIWTRSRSGHVIYTALRHIRLRTQLWLRSGQTMVETYKCFGRYFSTIKQQPLGYNNLLYRPFLRPDIEQTCLFNLHEKTSCNVWRCPLVNIFKKKKKMPINHLKACKKPV